MPPLDLPAATVLCEVADGVATVTLNRPDRLNAWNRTMETDFRRVVGRVRADPAVRAVVLTGAGRGFCSGADLGTLDAAAAGEQIVDEEDPFLPTDLIGVPKPVIAAVNGPAAGLGLMLALCCDVRFAAAGAKLTAIFPRRGLIAEYGSGWLLPRLVGIAGALDILLSGRVLLAEEAERIGLVNRVLPAEEVLGHAFGYARDLAASCAPGAMRTIKSQVYGSLTVGLDAAVGESLRLMADSLRSEDFREAAAAAAEGRQPRFRDLE